MPSCNVCPRLTGEESWPSWQRMTWRRSWDCRRLRCALPFKALNALAALLH